MPHDREQCLETMGGLRAFELNPKLQNNSLVRKPGDKDPGGGDRDILGDFQQLKGRCGGVELSKADRVGWGCAQNDGN